MRKATPALPGAMILPGLSETGSAALLDELRRLREMSHRVLLTGHQSWLGELLRLWARVIRRLRDSRVIKQFPRGAVAVLEADVAAWSGLEPGTAEVGAFLALAPARGGPAAA